MPSVFTFIPDLWGKFSDYSWRIYYKFHNRRNPRFVGQVFRRNADARY